MTMALWRGTGRRRAVDALAAARNRLRTYEAALDGIQDERDRLDRQLADLREHYAYQGRALTQAREENAQLRHNLRAAHAEVERLRADLQARIEVEHRLEVANRRLDREVKGAAETQALDVAGLRAEHAAPVAATVPLDDDTLTLPVPATAPAPAVHDADEPTRPVASLAALRMATPVRPLPGSTSPTTVPVRTLADMGAGGDAA